VPQQRPSHGLSAAWPNCRMARRRLWNNTTSSNQPSIHESLDCIWLMYAGADGKEEVLGVQGGGPCATEAPKPRPERGSVMRLKRL
jgi:hypothetical protein